MTNDYNYKHALSIYIKGLISEGRIHEGNTFLSVVSCIAEDINESVEEDDKNSL